MTIGRKKRKSPLYKRIWETLDRTEKIQEENAKGLAAFQASTEKNIAELRASTEKNITELRASTEKNITELRASTEAFQVNTEAFRASTEKNIAELRASTEAFQVNTEKNIAELQKAVGHLGNRFGEFAEHTLVPNLKEKFKKYGFNFSKLSENVNLDDKEHRIHAEIDALLENGGEAMAVEVKIHLKTDNIDEHIKRMEKIRAYADLHGDDRKFYGSLAAAVAGEEVKTYALKQGFYVIEPSGEDVKVTPPFSNRKFW
ncbi:MAG: hypothetical protein LBD29_04365 [Treponema sp.]|jgi:hypothetical protein|nr:hypothetical protein [Treponema sp.]